MFFQILIKSFWNKNKCLIRVSSSESFPNALNFKIHDSRNSKVKIKVNGKKVKAKKLGNMTYICVQRPRFDFLTQEPEFIFFLSVPQLLEEK